MTTIIQSFCVITIDTQPTHLTKPRVHTVHILQGFVLNVDFGIYLDHIFCRNFAGVHINTSER